MERSAGLRPAAARSAERAQEIPWVFERLNVLRLTEPRSAVTEIDLSNTPLIPAPFFSLSSLKEEQGRGEEANVYKLESLTPALPMNLLGAPACRAEASERRLTSRRPVGSRNPELAGETPVVAELCPGKPALPGTVPRFRGSWGGSYCRSVRVSRCTAGSGRAKELARQTHPQMLLLE